MATDILIIGGGVIGLAIARELHKRGVRGIAVVDRGAVGGEASSAAAGMLAPNAECDRPDDFHRLCLESSALYPNFAAELGEETGIDIQLDRTGTLYVAFSDRDTAEIQNRYRWQSAAGLDVRHLSASETLAIEPAVSHDVTESLLFPNDWQVENRRLVAALRAYCEMNGVRLCEYAEVSDLISENGRVIGANTKAGRSVAGQTVLAAGAWSSAINIGVGGGSFQVKPVRGQMLCYRPDERHLRHVIYSPRGYLVPRADGRVIAGSTVEDAGYEKKLTEDGINKIKTAAAEISSNFAGLDPIESWAGLRPFAAPDGLPVIGEIPGAENLFVATGHYRNGILLAPVTARIVADKILGTGSSEFLRLCSPARFAEATGGRL